MSTFNERQAKINSRKKTKVKNRLYSNWIASIRSMGIDAGMTLSEVKSRFCLDTIGTMFIDGKSVTEAYDFLSKLKSRI